MLRQRLLTALVLIPLTVWAVLGLSSGALALLLAMFVLLGAWEWGVLMGLNSHAGRTVYLGLMLLALWVAWSVIGRPGVLIGLLVLALAWWITALIWLVRYRPARKDGMAAMAAKGVAGILALTPAWAALVAVHANGRSGAYLLLLLLVLIWAADSGAFFAGRRWGSVKLAPQISPGKTREGVYGALAVAGLWAAAGGLWLGLQGLHLMLFVTLCLVTVLFSIVGDLFESMIKRQRGVKDSGHLFPGHGGVLDRVDSLTAAAPVFVLGLYWLEILA